MAVLRAISGTNIRSTSKTCKIPGNMISSAGRLIRIIKARGRSNNLNRVQFETSGFRLLTGKGSGINRRLWPKKRTTVSKLDAV